MNNVATDSLNGANNIVACQNLHKTYQGLDVAVLNGIDLTVNAGEQVAIVGTSGSGKSTLLHILGGLDTPSSGEVRILNQTLAQLSEAQKVIYVISRSVLCISFIIYCLNSPR